MTLNELRNAGGFGEKWAPVQSEARAVGVLKHLKLVVTRNGTVPPPYTHARTHARAHTHTHTHARTAANRWQRLILGTSFARAFLDTCKTIECFQMGRAEKKER